MVTAPKSNILYISLFFVILIGITSWLAINVTKNMLAQKQLQKDNPDFFMHNVVYTQIAEDGSLQNQLRSPEMMHYPLADTYEFTSPALTIIDASKQRWQINAARGVAKNNGQEIYLWDNVSIVKQGASPGREVMKVVTSAATVYPKQQTASTNRPITITQAGTEVHAVGAQVDFHASTIKLLSKVQGQYEAGKSNKN